MLVVSVTKVFCQSKPLPPEMIRVSVQPLSDVVTIDWKLSLTQHLDGYIVHEYKNTGSSGWNWVPFLQINDTTAVRAVFSYPAVRKGPVRFYVAAYKNNPTGPSVSDPPAGIPFHKTMFMQLKNDSCHTKMVISWSSYFGWFSNLSHYKIFQIKDGIDLQVVKDNILPADTTFSADIEPNRSYCFYVCAINGADGTITSLSNDSCLFTKMANPPAYINADYASFNPNSSNPVRVQFSIDPNSQLRNYQLYVSDNPDNGFIPQGSPQNAAFNSVAITDNIAVSPKYYRLEALNNCGNTTTVSTIATAIVPRASVQGSQANLLWNAYRDWTNSIQQYNIYRAMGTDAPLLIGSTATTDFTDNLSQLAGQGHAGNVCYYVEAISKPDNFRNVNKSISSNYCIDLSESIFVPNAFTPNGDGVNDLFMASFAFLPKDFVLIVYNRYGFKVFETNDLLKGWDGTFGNGQKAPEGTYVYFIRFTSQTGKNIERKGNVSLIYP